MTRFHIALIIGLFLCIMPDAYGQSNRRYVSDVLHVPVRSGPSTAHRILRHIRSGDVVTVLEQEEGGEYARIRLQDEEQSEGWVIARFLLDEPIAQLKLTRLEKQMEDLRKQQSPMRENLEKVNQELRDAKREVQELTAQKNAAESALAEIRRVASDRIDLHERNQQLKGQLQDLEGQLSAVQKDNELLLSDRRNEGIKLGLLAVGLGGFVGFILPYVKPRGRRGRSSRLR